MGALLVVAGGILAATATAFGLGVWCLTEPEPGTDCGLLLAGAWLVGLPLGVAAAIVGAARAGWLERWGEEPEAEPQPAPGGRNGEAVTRRG